MILDEIAASKRAEVAELLEQKTLTELRVEAENAPGPRDFEGALRSRNGSLRLIAEVKRKSPSKGVFRPGLDAAELARTYARHGAACISVLTDGPFFQGSLDDLRAVRAAVELPLLRKEFIVHAAQIYETRAAGGDAILLIAAILDDTNLAAFHHLAGELGMSALVEVHDEAELRRVLPLQPALIGINNRDLRTFGVDLATTERLRPLIPTTGWTRSPARGGAQGTASGAEAGTGSGGIQAECIVVGESGIHTRADAVRLQRAGVQAILVGESLIMAPDIAAHIRELLGTRN